jgi:hypothetical protein
VEKQTIILFTNPKNSGMEKMNIDDNNIINAMTRVFFVFNLTDHHRPKVAPLRTGSTVCIRSSGSH